MDNNSLIQDGADARFRHLSGTIRTAIEHAHIPGMAVGILHDGTERSAGIGVTNADHPLSVDGDTLFQIGSTTKTLTATVIMRLVEAGLLDLDVPVRAYLPALHLADEDVAAHVTVRHLLTHTAGWEGDYFADFGPGDDALARLVATLDRLPQLTPLGAIWSYNNAGFYLAGRLIEVVTGETYEAAAQRLVLDPLAMTRSFFFAADVITHRVAAGHTTDAHGSVVARPWAIPRAHNPAGGLICSMQDLLRYARFHLGDGHATDGTALLLPATMALMQSPLTPTGPFGAAWQLEDIEGTRVVTHNGGTYGQRAAFRLVPDRGFAIALLANADNAMAVFPTIIAQAFDAYLDLRERALNPLDVPTDDLVVYVGRYVGADIDLDVGLDHGHLVMTEIVKARFGAEDSALLPTPSPMGLALYGEDHVVVRDGLWTDQRADFVRTPDGAIRWLRFLARLHVRQG